MEAAFPGVVIGGFSRFQEIHKCLSSECESWVLKVEKVLSHVAFILGFSSPSRLIWKFFKSRIRVATRELGEYLEGHPELEAYLQSGLGFLESVGLSHVWDYVRDGSICMRFNNCDNDFLAQLSNIKIRVCEVENPRIDTRPITVCEKVFNDSPLIILAGAMVVLMLVANKRLKMEDFQNDDSERNPTEETAASDENKDKKSTTPSPPPDPSTPPDPPPDPSNPPSNPGPDPGGPANPLFSSPTTSLPSTSSASLIPPATQSNNKDPCSSPGPNGNEQIIHAKCPKCSKSFDCSIPRPWILYCSRSFPLLIKKRPRTPAPPKESVTDEAVREMLKEIKCGFCKSKIKKCLKEIQKARDKKDKEQSDKKSD